MKIVLKAVDGSVAIMELAPEADKDEAIRKFKECHPGRYISCHENIAIPEDRTHRDAWVLKRNKIIVDPVKAAALPDAELTLEERIKQLEDNFTRKDE